MVATFLHSYYVSQAEQRRREEEELKRQENELAFKAWLMRKKEQLQEERRIHRAQEIERMNCQVWPQGGIVSSYHGCYTRTTPPQHFLS